MKNVNIPIIKGSIFKGLLASSILLLIYIVVVALVSGWDFAQGQFEQFWFFIVTLAIGFGVQVSLFTYLKNVINQNGMSKRVLAVSGTTSTAAMISCCAHYLVNLLPILGAVGIITIIAQYQIQLFWIGLAFNLIGILYMLNRVVKFTHAV